MLRPLIYQVLTGTALLLTSMTLIMASPGSRWSHTAVLTNGALYVMGGIQEYGNASRYLPNDTFTYMLDVSKPFNVNSPPWTPISAGGILPPETANHIAAENNGSILMTAGTMSTPTGEDYVWSFNLKNFSWSRQHPHPTLPARPYYAASAAVNGTIYLHGGVSSIHSMGGNVSTMYYNTFHQLNTETMAWTDLPATTMTEGVRSQHTMTYIASQQAFYVIGGMMNETDLAPTDSVLKYSLKDQQWTKVATKGTAPKQRRTHTAVALGDKIIIFGGCGQKLTDTMYDTFVLDTTTMTWSKPEVKDAPQGRCGHTATMLGRYMLVAFGYLGNRGSDKVYLLDTNSWEFVDHFPGIQMEGAEEEDGLSVWAIIGIVIGALFALAIIIGLITRCIREEQRRQTELQIRLAAAAKLDESQRAHSGWFKGGARLDSIMFMPKRGVVNHEKISSSRSQAVSMQPSKASASQSSGFKRTVEVYDEEMRRAEARAAEHNSNSSLPLRRPLSSEGEASGPMAESLATYNFPTPPTPSYMPSVNSRAYDRHRNTTTLLAAPGPAQNNYGPTLTSSRAQSPEPRLMDESLIDLASYIIPDNWPEVDTPRGSGYQTSTPNQSGYIDVVVQPATTTSSQAQEHSGPEGATRHVVQVIHLPKHECESC